MHFLIIFHYIASKYLETAEIDIVQSEDCIKNQQLNLFKFGESGELESLVQKHLPTFLISLNKDDTR